MPKTEIDYSNTIIYKIICKDTTVTDVYVGHTTNFVQRKHGHKQSCINDKSPNYKCKLYEVIRKNGGWCNWSMEILNFFNCQDHYEARQKEQEYFVSLNATLNSIEPMPKPKFKPRTVTENKEKQTFYCEKCNLHCDNAKLLEIHNNTKKHQKNQIKPLKFFCNICDFNTSNKKDFKRHNLTDKHLLLTNPNEITPKNPLFICSCGKMYKHSSSLCAHKKKCIINEKSINEQPSNNEELHNQITPELIMSVLHQNKELQQMLIEQGKTIIELSKNNSITNNTTHTNSHNKAFNLNFFLNETCKDAMNIMDFVDSIKIQLCDLEKVGEIGYVEGISKIIVKNLNLLDETKRPVHCTDTKREVMYVKDDNKWEKENEDKQKMRKVIKHVTHKNSKLLKDFKNKYPGCEKSDSKYSDTYDKLIIEAMGGKGDNYVEKEDKIIKNIAKKITIDKHNE